MVIFDYFDCQIWLCGGSIVVHPCSRVGHLFRMRRPYQSKAGLDTNLYNTVRAAKVWFDEYQVQKKKTINTIAYINLCI